MGVALGVARNSFSLAPSGQEFIIELDAKNGSGSTWTDSSGSELDATLISTSIVSAGSTSYVPVDGSADYAKVNVGTAFDSLGQFTIECVMRTDGISHARPRFNFNKSNELGFRLVNNQNSPVGWNYWTFRFNGTNYNLDDKTSSNSSSTYGYGANTMTYVAATYDGTTLKSYFGKNSSVSNVSTTTVAESDRGLLDASYKSNKNLEFGREANYDPDRFLAARFYYFSLKDKTSSSSEITDRFNAFDTRFTI